jgi:regulator of cell morphogenesis and NO signaling
MADELRELRAPADRDSTRIGPTSTVAEIALHTPGATRLFESLHLDYGCLGASSLSDACAELGLNVERVVVRLNEEALVREERSVGARWASEPLDALTKYIVERHHVYTRFALASLDTLATKAVSLHGAAHPELEILQGLVRSVDSELRPHLYKEERVLFPYIEMLATGQPDGFGPRFGLLVSARGPIGAMMHEHRQLGLLLRQVRTITHDYVPPEEASASWRALYDALHALECDLFRHVHLESNVLFPRTLEMERSG